MGCGGVSIKIVFDQMVPQRVYEPTNDPDFNAPLGGWLNA
jgi:hypothetical protein